METVHFVDEHSLHYEALVTKAIDENMANLCVWSYGHVRLVEHAPHSFQHTPMSWHRATVHPDGKSICEGNIGFVTLSEDERKTLHDLAEKPEQGV